jgi:hypothetical protein
MYSRGDRDTTTILRIEINIMDLHVYLFDLSYSIQNIMIMLFASMCE